MVKSPIRIPAIHVQIIERVIAHFFLFIIPMVITMFNVSHGSRKNRPITPKMPIMVPISPALKPPYPNPIAIIIVINDKTNPLINSQISMAPCRGREISI